MTTPTLIAMTFRKSHVAIGISRLSDAQFIEVNDAFLKLFGFERSEVIGRTSLQLGLWPIVSERDELITRLNRGDDVSAYEVQQRDRHGRIHHVLISASLLEHNGERYLVGLLTDITERRKAEIALRESEERFRLFMDNSPTIAWIKDEAGHYVYLSKTYEDCFGVRLENWAGKTDEQLWPSETAEVFRKNDLDVLSANAPVTLAEETIGPDGRTNFWLIKKFPFSGAAGNRYVAGIGLDITERKEAELATLESAERLNLAMTGSNLGSWDWNIQTGVVHYDKRCCELLGYTEQDIEPSIASWERLVNPTDRASAQDALATHFKGDVATYQSEHRLRHANGHWVWISASGRILQRAADGRPLRMVGTVLDVTGRKRLGNEGMDLLQKIQTLIREASTIAEDGQASGEQLETLTRRQRQLLELIAAGNTSAEIALKLRIAKATAIAHRRALMEKLDLHSAAELTRFAIENDVLKSRK